MTAPSAYFIPYCRSSFSNQPLARKWVGDCGDLLLHRAPFLIYCSKSDVALVILLIVYLSLSPYLEMCRSKMTNNEILQFCVISSVCAFVYLNLESLLVEKCATNT